MHPIRPLFAVLTTGLLLLLVGCGGGSASSESRPSGGDPGDRDGTADAAVPAATDLSPEERERRQLEADWKRLQSRLAAVPATDKQREIAEFVRRAERFAQQYGVASFELLREARKALEDVEKDFELEALDALARLEEKVEEIISRENPDFIRAENAIARFKQEELKKYRGTDLGEKVSELQRKVELHRDAEMKLLALKGRLKTLGDDYVRILALLAGFPPEYAETPYGEEVERLTNENYALYVETASKKKPLDAIRTKKWPLELYEDWSSPDEEDVVSLEEELLTLGPNPSDWDLKDEQGSYIAIGKPEWIDVWIQMEVQVTDPANVYIGARGRVGPDGRSRFFPLSLESFEMEEGEWYNLTVVIEGGRFDITSSGTSGRAGLDRPMSYQGIGQLILQVRGDQAQIKVRKLEYKTLREAGSQDGGGEEENGGDEAGEEDEGEGEGEEEDPSDGE